MLLKDKNIKLIKGSDDLLAKFFLSHQERLSRRILRYTGEESVVQDINQELFIKLWIKREELHHVEDLTAYLFRMAHNICINYLRRKNCEHNLLQHTLELHKGYSNITEELIFHKEMEVLLHQAIQKLSPQCRKVYLLAKTEGLPLDKIAFFLKVSLNTVKNQMVKANVQIRKYLDENTSIEGKKRRTKGKLKNTGFSATKIFKAA